MTGCINEFDEDKNKNINQKTITMPLKVSNKQLVKKYNKISKKN